MSDQDIFEKEDKETKEDKSTIITNDGDLKKPDEPNTTDQLLASIVNESGEQKYKTVEEVIKAATHAQTHIQKLEKENAEFKEKGNASDKLDELLEAVKQSQGSGDGQEQLSPTMNPKDVLGIVKDFFDTTKIAETREDNINTVTKVFRDRYGKDASKELYDKANDLGYSRGEINNIIATNPNAALNTLGIKPKEPSSADPTVLKSSVSPAQFQGESDDKPKKSIMGVTKQGELKDAWKASQARTLKRLSEEDAK